VLVSSSYAPLYSSQTTIDNTRVMYRIQGTDNEYNAYSNVFRSTNLGKTWTDVSIGSKYTLPGTRYLGAAVALQSTPSTLLVIGGASDPSKLLSDVWRSTDKGATWRVATANAPFGAVVSTSTLSTLSTYQGGSYDVVYKSGGSSIDPSSGMLTYTNDVWISMDLVPSVGTKWVQLTDAAPWQGRANAFVTMTSNGILVLVGGSTDQASAAADVWVSLDGGQLPHTICTDAYSQS
jgi:hypothetical protein